MKSTLLTAISAVTITAAGSAHAGGLDRSGTPIEIIFEKGNRAELTFGTIMPSVTGTDLLGNDPGDVADRFSQWGAAVKYEYNDKLSFAIIMDQPYGADVEYGGDPTTTLLGGTSAEADSIGLTALLRYKFSDRFSVYGGPRMVDADGAISLSGQAYGPLNGYNVRFNSDTGYGYVLGAAYEIPEMALRAALTYHSEVDLSMGTAQQPPGAPGFAVTPDTKVTLPQSVKLAVQSGVAPGTLVFGSVRWSEWSKFSLDPFGPTPNLAEFDDVWTYELGVGRRFNDRFSGSASIIYEPGGSDDLVSPLSPTNGSTSLTVGGKYQVTDNVDVSAGVRYTWLGDAQPETGTPDVARGNFSDNSVVSVGFKVGVQF
ncbi:outer membrane protein transport protein [Roseovarius sp. SCSIO 43702]|uniref:OmpP1/FadL family transporter n=1 Tax=Roseovarius sp. SCSIO 43702 TaxID=2823043 RepID=UPI001C73195D|nr:outer membrane protein transport protein [Roseovarius sp. SCSIO 43702]QYX55303.1 outer membrane protein transport protein [Roseovarius sp. SCSIO 43702]